MACRLGLRGLAEDGWRLVREGVTTPEEVFRVTKAQSANDGAEDRAAELVVSGETEQV